MIQLKWKNGEREILRFIQTTKFNGGIENDDAKERKGNLQANRPCRD